MPQAVVNLVAWRELLIRITLHLRERTRPYRRMVTYYAKRRGNPATT
jgi:hypothetical protein